MVKFNVKIKEYSLVERNIEREYIPAARECGLGIAPWSPLAAGFLAGKYSRNKLGDTEEGRLSGPNPFGSSKFTDQNWRVLETLRTVATQLDRPLAQVALAWASAQSVITAGQLRTLDEASALPPVFPYPIFRPAINQVIFGGHTVKGWQYGGQFNQDGLLQPAVCVEKATVCVSPQPHFQATFAQELIFCKTVAL